MPLRRVEQVDSDGCFVACVATVINKTYEETRRLILPNWKKHDRVGMTPEKSLERLRELGFQFVEKKGKRRIRDLKETSFLLIRWRIDPTSMHTVIWDAKARKVIDPDYGVPLRRDSLERQLDTVVVLKKIPCLSL